MNKNTLRQFASNRTTRMFFILTGLSFFLLPFAAYWNSQAAGAISGRVFRDYNGNGVRDTANPAEPGVAGITINAYDAAGNSVSTVSAADGTYTTALVTGNVRLEFIVPTPAAAACNVDSNGTFSGGSGNVYGTSVRFVSEGATGVNFAVSSPGEYYTTDNPTVGVPLYNAGDPTGGGTAGTNSAFEVFSYNADSNTPTPASRAEVREIGTVWGSAYSPQAGRYFLSTAIKRHTGTGPLGASGIYTVDPNTAVSGSNFIDLSAVGAAASNTSGTYPYNDGKIGSGTNNQAIPFSDVVGANSGAAGGRHRGLPKDVAPQPSLTYSSYDAAAFEQAGKLAFGGLEISPDGRYLYAVNLYTKSLVRVDLRNPAAPVTPTAAQVASYAIPDPGCVGGNFRPWAAKYFRGKIYVGGVCDAQTTGAAANLKAYVYEFDIATNSFNATPVINGYNLNYTKGKAIAADNTNVSTKWYPWTNNYNDLLQTFSTENTKYVRPQPIFADIEFDDADGSIIAAFMDRTGLQAGYRNWGPRDVQPDLQAASSSATNGAVEVSGGDVLRFYKNPAAGCAFVAESGGISNGVSGSGAGNNQGPGGGEFFGAESFDVTKHSETITGALAVNYGSRAVMATNFDAFNGGDVNSGGVRRFDMANGGLVAGTNGYNVYLPTTRGVTFAKGTGLGDIEILRQSSPIELGNRVWRDTNSNGVQDPGENGISGVAARLYRPGFGLDGIAGNADDNQPLAIAVTTSTSGEYYFKDGTAADATPNDNVGTFNGEILPSTAYEIRFDRAADYQATPTVGVLNGLVPTKRDQTAQAGFDDGSDSDAFRVTNPTGSPAGTFPVITVTTGTAGANDHTLDVGFAAPVSVGSTVFNDPNNNGAQDTGETGIGGVTVELLYDADGSGTITGTELTTALATTTTSTGAGAALGNYFFGSLTPGNYQVRIPNAPAAATVSSTVTDTTDNGQDSDDNGTQTGGAGGSTISPIINLVPGAEPLNAAETGQGNTADDAAPNADANGDMTVDFGFFAPASLGDTVFSDVNRNGVQNGAGEPGINGVTVTLYGSDCATAITTTTTATVGANAGQYSFTGLAPGTYCVGFTLPTGFGYGFTVANTGTGTDATDSDANPATGKTGTYTLIAGQNDTTVDAGLVQTVSLGNQVFNDADNNGVRNGAETGIVGATVNLYLDANNDGTPDGGIVATTTTVADGLYLFSRLAPNTYIVAVVTPANLVSSSVNGGDPDANPADNDDNGVITNGTETRSNPVTLTLTGEPLTENPDNDADTPDAAENLTVDFGFTAAYSIGNRVWFDTNNNGLIEAVAGNTEVGINGVSVSVFASSDLTTALATTATDASGYYRFDNLIAGTYVIRVNPSSFANGAVLAGYQNTTGNTATDLDSTAVAGQIGEDGINPSGAANTVQINGISSSVVTLGAFAEPIGETDVFGGTVAGQGTADNQANMTIDFGFYRMNLSGTVWNDNGGGTAGNINNGFLNAGEPGLNGARVQLYSGATEILVGPDGVLGTADDAANGVLTIGTGNYNFQGLPPGTYRVVVTPPGGATSSTPTQSNADDNVDNDDNGFANTTEGFAGKIISGTIALAPATETSTDNAIGLTSNPTVDFGFTVAAPTVVKMDKFDAYSDGSAVELRWSTGDEASNLGFNVYREVGGKRQLLNRAPVAGNALRSGVQLAANGSDYSWTIKESVPNAVYYLEDLDVDGSANLHGAVAPQFRQTLGQQPNARTLADLANVETSEALTETVSRQRNSVPNKKQAAAAAIRQQQIAAAGGAKITINRDGWYRVSAEQLTRAGFDTNTNSQQWQLYADGAEVPFKLNSDSIEFFGCAADTALNSKQVYYLVNASTSGLRINAVEGGSAGENADASSYGVTVERRDRAVYVSSILNGDEDNWFGAVVSRSSETVQNLNAFAVDELGQARLTVKLQGIVAGEHVVNVKFNDQPLGTVEFDGFENKQFEFDLPASAVREGANAVRLQANGGSDTSLVDAIRLGYQRGYTAQDNRIRFTVPAGQTARVGGFTNADISVYELGDAAARQQANGAIENASGVYGFSLSAANADREMIAVTNSTMASAAVTRNVASTWNDPANQADFVIVTTDELQASADDLAAMRQAQGLKTQVVLVEDLFDEFSFGKTDPNAVKQFLQTAATKWQTKPQYALLFGDASYDARNNLGLSVTRNLVPTKSVDTEFMETSSDAWLADFDGDGAEDLALGRLPVGNRTEAAAAVEKLARFDGQAARQQKTDLLIADTGFEIYSETLQTLLPTGVNAFRIDRSGATDAETHRSIVEQLNRNPLLVTYTGHGSQNVWANSGIFSSSDAAKLANGELSFYLLMNCLNGYSNQPTGESLAETLFKNPNGAIAVWTSSGITHPGSQAAISQAFTNLAFNAKLRKSLRVGDVVKAAKRAAGDADVRRTWHLIGDPTVFIK